MSPAGQPGLMQDRMRKSVSGSKLHHKKLEHIERTSFEDLETVEDAGQLHKTRLRVKAVLKHMATDVCLGLVVLFDIWSTAFGIDCRANGDEEPEWMVPAVNFCLAAYIIELSCQFFVKRLRLFKDKWLVLDLGFVVAGLFELIVAGLGISLDSIGILRILRVARIARLVKLFRKFTMLKELRKILMMAASCMKTLLWSFLFCYIVMTSFAMASVEFMASLVKDLEATGVLETCGDSCTRSMDSVTKANLYYFKTVIAGDGWGSLAWPMMENHPWTAVFFVGTQLVLVFGVLNLIVAVVVDTAAEQRLKNVANLAEELEAETETDLKFLARIFSKIDDDRSGEFTLEQLLHSANTLPEFQSRLRVMDIDLADLEQLFYMLDSDGGGTVDQTEFTGALSRWMLNDSKTASRFAKQAIHEVMVEQKNLRDAVNLMTQQVQGLLQYLGSPDVAKLEPRVGSRGSGRQQTGIGTGVTATTRGGTGSSGRRYSDASGERRREPGNESDSCVGGSYNSYTSQSTRAVSAGSSLVDGLSHLLQPLAGLLEQVKDDVNKATPAIDTAALRRLEDMLAKAASSLHETLQKREDVLAGPLCRNEDAAEIHSLDVSTTVSSDTAKRNHASASHKEERDGHPPLGDEQFSARV